jgi:hypothetical protein
MRLQIFVIFNLLELFDSQRQWIFLHYHKTGAVLSETIAREISRKRFLFFEDPNKRMDFHPSLEAEVVLSHAGNFLFDWLEIFSSNYRVIHFVRDPYQMILSGLLYHSQIPPAEGWLLSNSINPCSCDEKGILRFAEALLTYHTSLSRTLLLKSLEQIVLLCHEIHHSSTIKYGSNYHIILSTLFSEDPVQAIRLEACRSILSKFSGSGGDLLRMTANSVHENQALDFRNLKSISKRIFLSQFSLENRSKYREAATEIFQFLLTPSATDQDFWKDKLNLSEAIHLSEIASFYNSSLAFKRKVRKKNGHRRRLPAALSRFRSPNQQIKPILSQQAVRPYRPPSESFLQAHITKGRLSEAKRNDLLRELRDDPVLGPFLNLAQLILSEPHPQNSTSVSLRKALSQFQDQHAE